MLEAFIVPFLWVLGAGLALVIVAVIVAAIYLMFAIIRTVIVSGADAGETDGADGEG